MGPRGPAGPVTVVTCAGDGSMEDHGRRLAAAVQLPELRADVARRSAQRFGVAALSAQAAGALAADAAFVRQLRHAPPGPLHLTSHHLARYGPPSGRPYVVTVHDVIRQLDAADRTSSEPLIEPLTARDRAMLALDRRGIRRAAACIAISAHSASTLVDHLQIPPDRVHVVAPGIDHARFKPTTPRPHPERYVLFVGSEHPRKNLETLIAAHAQLRREPGLSDLALVKVGAPGNPPQPFRERTLTALRAHGTEAIFAGRVPDEDLPGWYAGAACLVLPSRHEGFGLPPVEAMACGCPVIVADAGALPEVAGHAALTIHPDDVRGLGQAIRAVVEDPQLATTLRARGLRRAAQFTWDRAAEATKSVYAAVWPEAVREITNPAVALVTGNAPG